MPYFSQSHQPPRTPPLEGSAKDAISSPPLSQLPGYVHANSSASAAMPPSPSDFLLPHKLPPIDALRGLAELAVSDPLRLYEVMG
jgi:hypothetical protein